MDIYIIFKTFVMYNNVVFNEIKTNDFKNMFTFVYNIKRKILFDKY